MEAIEHRPFELSITTTCNSVQYELYLWERWQPTKFKTFLSETSYDPSSAVHIYDYLISISIQCVMLFYLASMVFEIGKFWSTANIFNLKGTSTYKTKIHIRWCWKRRLQCGFVFSKSTKKQLIWTKIETDPRSRRTVINVSTEESTQN